MGAFRSYRSVARQFAAQPPSAHLTRIRSATIHCNQSRQIAITSAGFGAAAAGKPEDVLANSTPRADSPACIQKQVMLTLSKVPG